MKNLALICLSPLLFINVASAGGQQAPQYAHPKNVNQKSHLFTGFGITGAVGGVAGELDATQNFNGQSFAGDSATGGTTLLVSVNDEITDASRVELGDANVAGLIALEYMYQFSNGLVLGFAGTAGFNNIEIENTLQVLGSPELVPLDIDNNKNLNNSSFSSRMTVELENDFAVLFKPGFVIRENTLVYGLIGPRWGSFESTLKTTYNSNGVAPKQVCVPKFRGCGIFGWDGTLTDSDSTSEYEIGITAGVGVRQVITKHFMLGLEYAFTHYGDLASLQNSSDPGVFLDSVGAPGTLPLDLLMKDDANAENMSMNTHSLMATLSYKF